MSDKKNLLEQLEREGHSADIINAFAMVDRARFVPGPYQDEVYRNEALPVGYGQTISQPSTIAFMLDKLEVRNGQKILEVGSGSGYVLALLHYLAPEAEIYGAERVEELVHDSRYNLGEQPHTHIYHTPSGLGLPDKAPFDRILVSAAAQQNLPRQLVEQLKKEGVIVCPVAHSIIKAKKHSEDELSSENYPGFAFVPLIEN